MNKTPLFLAIALAIATGCVHNPAPLSPQQRTQAIRLYVEGASPGEIAAQLSVPRDDARAAIRTTLLELSRRYYREH